MPVRLNYMTPPRNPKKRRVVFWVVFGLIALLIAALGPAIIEGP
jgi:hypothetical protein